MGTGASSGGCWTHDLFLARAGPQMNAWKPLHWALVVILVRCTPSGRYDTSAVWPDGKPLRAPDVRYEPTPRSVVPRLLDLAPVPPGVFFYFLGSAVGPFLFPPAGFLASQAFAFPFFSSDAPRSELQSLFPLPFSF